MKFDTVLQMPGCNPPDADSGITPETHSADMAPDLPLLALLSNRDPSGESNSPDSSISAGEAAASKRPFPLRLEKWKIHLSAEIKRNMGKKSNVA